MSGRIYAVNFKGVTVSAIQDLITLYAGSSMALKLHGIILGQVTSSTVALLGIGVKRLPATVTTGSGGSAPTPARMSPGDAAATFTARANDTTQATTSGSAVDLHEDVFNVVNGYQFFWPPEERPIARPDQALVFELRNAPASGVAMSGTVIVEELF